MPHWLWPSLLDAPKYSQQAVVIQPKNKQNPENRHGALVPWQSVFVTWWDLMLKVSSRNVGRVNKLFFVVNHDGFGRKMTTGNEQFWNPPASKKMNAKNLKIVVIVQTCKHYNSPMAFLEVLRVETCFMGIKNIDRIINIGQKMLHNIQIVPRVI